MIFCIKKSKIKVIKRYNNKVRQLKINAGETSIILPHQLVET
jgi:hypothetical protein